MRDHIQFAYEGTIKDCIDRNSVYSVQSPDAYRCSFLMDVFRKAQSENHSLDESCCTMLLYNLGYDTHFIEGGPYNIKLVHQEDLPIISVLLRNM